MKQALWYLGTLVMSALLSISVLSKSVDTELAEKLCPLLTMKYVSSTYTTPSRIEYWHTKTRVLVAVVTEKKIPKQRVVVSVYKMLIKTDTGKQLKEFTIQRLETPMDWLVAYAIIFKLQDVLKREFEVTEEELYKCETPFYAQINKK